MTSELLSEQNPNQTDSTSKSPNGNFTQLIKIISYHTQF